MSMQTYPICGYGLAFTSDQIQALFKKILAVRHADENEDMRPESINEAIDDLNDESYDWFVIDNNSDSNFNAVITRNHKLLPEDFDNGILYIPYGVQRIPWEHPTKTKEEWFKDVKNAIGDILPDGYRIEENFVFAQWCQFG